MINIYPSDISRVISITNGEPEFHPELPNDIKIRTALDKIQFWPIAGNDKEENLNDETSKEISNTETLSDRQTVLNNMHQALYELDQLISVSKMLKQKDNLNLEACHRSLKILNEKNHLQNFQSSIKEAASVSSRSLRKGFENAKSVLSKRANFLKDLKVLKNLRWKMIRIENKKLAIDCSPTPHYKSVSVLDSNYTLLNIGETGCTLDEDLVTSSTHRVLKVSFFDCHQKSLLASVYMRDVIPFYLSNGSEDQNRIYKVHDFCRLKVENNLSKEILNYLKNEIQLSGTNWVLRNTTTHTHTHTGSNSSSSSSSNMEPIHESSSSSSSCSSSSKIIQPPEMLQEALNDPLLPGVEIRNNSEYLIELGVTRNISLVFETVKASEKANHSVAFPEALNVSNTPNSIKYSDLLRTSSPDSQGYTSNLEELLNKLLNITILEAEHFYRKSIHSQIILEGVKSNENTNENATLTPYSRFNLDNHFTVNNLSWERFIELGCYNKASKRKAFELVETQESVRSFKSIHKYILYHIMKLQLNTISSNLETFFEANKIEFKSKKEEGSFEGDVCTITYKHFFQSKTSLESSSSEDNTSGFETMQISISAVPSLYVFRVQTAEGLNKDFRLLHDAILFLASYVMTRFTELKNNSSKFTLERSVGNILSVNSKEEKGNAIGQLSFTNSIERLNPSKFKVKCQIVVCISRLFICDMVDKKIPEKLFNKLKIIDTSKNMIFQFDLCNEEEFISEIGELVRSVLNF